MMEKAFRRSLVEEVANSEQIKDSEKRKTELHLTQNEYVWGGQIRDKRTHSMCARPYFRKP